MTSKLDQAAAASYDDQRARQCEGGRTAHHGVGSPVPGARNGVFASGAGSTYLLVTGFTVAGVAAAVGWVTFLLRTFRRRKAEPETPQRALNVN